MYISFSLLLLASLESWSGKLDQRSMPRRSKTLSQMTSSRAIYNHFWSSPEDASSHIRRQVPIWSFEWLDNIIRTLFWCHILVCSSRYVHLYMHPTLTKSVLTQLPFMSASFSLYSCCTQSQEVCCWRCLEVADKIFWIEAGGRSHVLLSPAVILDCLQRYKYCRLFHASDLDVSHPWKLYRLSYQHNTLSSTSELWGHQKNACTTTTCWIGQFCKSFHTAEAWSRDSSAKKLDWVGYRLSKGCPKRVI